MAQYLENFIPVVQYHNLNTQKLGAVSMPSGSTDNIDFSNSSGTFKTPTGAHTIGGSITLAAGKSITGAAGAGAVDWSAMTGTFKFPSGFASGYTPNVISGAGATVTLTAAQTGSLVLFDRAAGIVYTLPAPAVGLNFTFLVAVTITSNSAKVITDAGTTLLAGFVASGVDNTANKQWVGNGSTHIAVTQNGTTTGGVIGSILQFFCTTTAQWCVQGMIVGSGVLATPFAIS